MTARFDSWPSILGRTINIRVPFFFMARILLPRLTHFGSEPKFSKWITCTLIMSVFLVKNGRWKVCFFYFEVWQGVIFLKFLFNETYLESQSSKQFRDRWLPIYEVRFLNTLDLDFGVRPYEQLFQIYQYWFPFRQLVQSSSPHYNPLFIIQILTRVIKWTQMTLKKWPQMTIWIISWYIRSTG